MKMKKINIEDFEGIVTKKMMYALKESGRQRMEIRSQKIKEVTDSYEKKRGDFSLESFFEDGSAFGLGSTETNLKKIFLPSVLWFALEKMTAFSGLQPCELLDLWTREIYSACRFDDPENLQLFCKRICMWAVFTSKGKAQSLVQKLNTKASELKLKTRFRVRKDDEGWGIAHLGVL
jgi:hypothetical protein